MGRAPRQKYDKFGGGRIEINEKEIQEQVDTIIQAFLAFPVNLRRKHIGAALRRACTLKQRKPRTRSKRSRWAACSQAAWHMLTLKKQGSLTRQGRSTVRNTKRTHARTASHYTSYSKCTFKFCWCHKSLARVPKRLRS